MASALTDITSGVLTAVAAAQYASITWAGGRWLTGQAPTHAVVATLDALQVTLGQGPCLEALREQHTVAVPDLDNETRWPVFAARAAEFGVGSMVSLPLSMRRERFGVLNLYATRPRAFTADDETIAVVFATRAAITLCQAAERDHVQALASHDRIGQAPTAPMDRHHLSTATVFDWLTRDFHRADLTVADLLRRLINEHVRRNPSARPDQTARRTGRLTTVATAVADGLRVTHGRMGDVIVVQARGEVDMLTAPRLGAALRAACVAVRPAGSLVIDLSGIRFFSAAGLTQLDTVRRYCRKRQLTLWVVATHRSVLRPLQITGLGALFDIAPTLAEATDNHPTRQDDAALKVRRG